MKSILAIVFLISTSAHGMISTFPSFINFYNVHVGGIGQSQRVMVRNSGRENVHVNANSTCFGDFQVSNFCLSLSPGGSCSIDVRFTPRREGYQSCSIWLHDDQGGSASVSVSGQGVR